MLSNSIDVARKLVDCLTKSSASNTKLMNLVKRKSYKITPFD